MTLNIILSILLGGGIGCGLTYMLIVLKIKSTDPERKFELPSFPDFPKKKEGRVVRNLDEKLYEIEQRRDI